MNGALERIAAILKKDMLIEFAYLFGSKALRRGAGQQVGNCSSTGNDRRENIYHP